MIRQARGYLMGAMSGATLIAIAIGIFVLLVSAQVYKDWPIAALGGGDEGPAAVSPGQPVDGTGEPGDRGASSTPVGVLAPPTGGSGRDGGAIADAGEPEDDSSSLASQGTPVPGTGADGDGGGPVSSPAPDDATPQAGARPPQTNGRPPASSGGGGQASTLPTPSKQIGETVDETVAKVEESPVGGVVGETGVTEVASGVVESVAGPESTVGRAVDETVGTVDGVLGGNR